MLKKLIAVSLVSVFVTACNINNAATTTSSTETSFTTYSAEEFFKTTTVRGSSINHTGDSVLISSDESGIYNAYRVPVDGSKPTQLTFSTKESIYATSWFPKDDRFIYTADQGGNELNHLYVKEENGKTIDLTPGDKLRALFLGWHQDQASFFVASNERDPRFFDLYRYQTSDYSRARVFTNEYGFMVQSVSPDGNFVALSKSNSNSDSDLFIADLRLKTTKPKRISNPDGNIMYAAYTFTPDSTQLLYSTNEFGEYNQAWIYDLKTETHSENVVAPWDVSFSYFSKDGKYQVTGINADSQTQLSIRNTDDNAALALPELPSGDLHGVSFSNDNRVMAFYVNSDTSPSNLYVHKIGSSTIKRLTDTGNPAIDEANLVASEVVRFESFDGLEIPTLLYKPKQAETQKVPAVIFIHGGPGGQSRKGYSAMIQHLVNNGIAVARINNRGSNGYGKTFYHLDDKKHGDHDLKDVIYNKKYLQSLEWVDADRIGVMGGSYGGYLTMAAMAFTEEFKVGVNIFGVTNWVRTLKSIPPYWEVFRKSLYDELGDPAVDGERLHSISPVFFGHQVKSPVLIVQGSNDPRVLKIESDEMVEAIKKAGTHVEYLVFDDEGHGFSKKVNRISASNTYLDFLNKFL